MIEVTNCVFCGSSNFNILYSRKDLRYCLDETVYNMNQCRDCEGLYLSPRISECKIGNYYPAEYYYEQLTLGEIMKKELNKNLKKYRYLRHMKPGKLLDVGCRHGSFIKFMELFGWETEGYEYDEGISNRFNCKIAHSDFSRLKGNSFDVITLWAVLEHLYHPNKYLEQMYEMLKPSGYLIIQVPKYNSFTGKLLLHEDVPRHVTAYTSTWIKSYVEKFGFQQVSINTRCDIFGGSSRGFLIYLIKRLHGNKEHALREIYRSDGRGTDSTLEKIDLFLSKYFDKMLRRTDYWGEMTIVYTKHAS